MNLEITENNEINITGNIKSIDESIEIKNMINNLAAKGSDRIQLNIKDSISMSSTTIGLLMKIVNHQKIKLSIVVGDKRLYSLLEELSLLRQFDVRLAKQQPSPNPR